MYKALYKITGEPEASLEIGGGMFKIRGKRGVQAKGRQTEVDPIGFAPGEQNDGR